MKRPEKPIPWAPFCFVHDDGSAIFITERYAKQFPRVARLALGTTDAINRLLQASRSKDGR